MRSQGILFSIVLACTLSACGTTRPNGPPDLLACDLRKFHVPDIYATWSAKYSPLLTSPLRGSSPISLNVLALSAGGEYGAYGAGFLGGWASVGESAIPSPRSDIQIVTGVSTGAILATHAFLGLDKDIERILRSISGPLLFRERPWFELITANSLLDDFGKFALIKDALDAKRISAVANAPEERALFIGVVDLDSAQFLRIDMKRLAKELRPESRRDDCYRAVVHASSAIPVAFPPVFVDDMMLVDGGARQHMFLTVIPKEAFETGVSRRLFGFVHGDLSVDCAEPRNGVVQIASRTAEIMTDQLQWDSVAIVEHFARAGPSGKANFQTRYASAAKAAGVCRVELTKCADEKGATGGDFFCKPYMNCLADQGRIEGAAAASGRSFWLTYKDLQESRPDSCPSGTVRGRRFR
jgi:hypothetical protein